MPNPDTTKLKFLFISSSDLYGGASIAGYRLHKSLIADGHISIMAVNRKISNDNTVIEVNGWIKRFYKNCIFGNINFPFSYRFGIFLREQYNNFYQLLKQTGREVFFYPTSKKILKILNYIPNIIHIHNVYGSLLDIRVLKNWSKNSKIFITLHDLWVFTGHCGIPLDCDKYLEGCGNCPDLNLPPSIPIDKTRENYLYKRRILSGFPIHFIAPSRWVFNKVKTLTQNQMKTMHPNSTIRIISNAVPENLFTPGDKRRARSDLSLPLEGVLILSSAIGLIRNKYKDFQTLSDAFDLIPNNNNLKNNIYLVILGEKQENYKSDNKNLIFCGTIYESNILQKYYNASDIYVHSSNIETWGLTISEALNTGLPVIASNVGAIPEQIKGYQYKSYKNNSDSNSNNIQNANGILFERGNSTMLAEQLLLLLENSDLRQAISKNKNLSNYHNRYHTYLQEHEKYYLNPYEEYS